MTINSLNDDAVRHCRALIDDGKYVLESSWSSAQPSTDAENRFIEQHGWDEYAKWHLGFDRSASEETKGRFGFIYGDFTKVHRSGLAAAAERAGQHGHREIERAAHELLEHLKSVAGEE